MRAALLGSPGVGGHYRTSFRTTGTPARLLNDPAATYAAVAPGAHLDVSIYVPGRGFVTEIVTFAGTENTRALYVAAINAALGHHFKAALATTATQIYIQATLLGSLAGGNILASTSVAVQAALGLTPGQTMDPSYGVRVIGSPNYGKNGIQYFGGDEPVFDGVPHAANQHAVVMKGGRIPSLIIVDRNVPRTVSSDLVRFAPLQFNPATPPPLGALAPFGVLAGTTVTNTATPTAVDGDLGVSPGGAVVNFPPGTVTGTIHAADATSAAAQLAATTAYNELAAAGPAVDLTGQNLGGMILNPGVYHFDSSAQLTGTLTLNAQGDPNAVWIFQMGSTLTTAPAAIVNIINGGDPCKVFWQVGSSATLGTTTAFQGTIIALTAITMNTGATLIGRAVARNAAVTLDANTITNIC